MTDYRAEIAKHYIALCRAAVNAPLGELLDVQELLQDTAFQIGEAIHTLVEDSEGPLLTQAECSDQTFAAIAAHRNVLHAIDTLPVQMRLDAGEV